MTDTKKPRPRRTDADEVHRLAQLRDNARKRWEKADEKYENALRSAHEKAAAAHASLPPLPKTGD